jgi:hypothetical protein
MKRKIYVTKGTHPVYAFHVWYPYGKGESFQEIDLGEAKQIQKELSEIMATVEDDKQLFSGVMFKIKEAFNEFDAITEQLPDGRFMGRYAQESFDVAMNSFLKLHNQLRNHLKIMNGYSTTLREVMNEESLMRALNQLEEK